ncbi:MAG: ABC transporter ATP-binding protein [Chloroflexi bacterium]|nr:ABC transporter ATP-binding protein [Chloroflexota bacterium]
MEAGRERSTDRAGLRIERLSKQFGGLLAIDDFELEVGVGAVHGIIGPNGAGKTTLMHIISGYLAPSSGRVWLGDTLLTGRPPHVVTTLGVARTFQKIRPFQGLTVLEVVMLGRHRHARAGIGGVLLGLPWVRREEEAVRSRAQEFLSFVGLSGRDSTPMENLPLGLQRLLQIASALATEPRLLLLDEPASGLSRDERSALERLLLRIHESGVTVLLVEHDVGLVMRVCETITVLNFGRKIAEGSPSSIQQDDHVRSAYLGVGTL